MLLWKSSHPLIDELALMPHPAGGYYRQSDPEQGHSYYLLLRGQVSRFHKAPFSEYWTFYEGAPARCYSLTQQQLHEYPLSSHAFQEKCVCNEGDFHAIEPSGAYTLLGCTFAAGNDFSLCQPIDEPAMRDWLTVSYPDMHRFM